MYKSIGVVGGVHSMNGHHHLRTNNSSVALLFNREPPEGDPG